MRNQIRLIATAAPTIALASLPCRVCGATSDAPEVIAVDGPVAYCTFAHARLHGWPWLQSEPAPGGTRQAQ